MLQECRGRKVVKERKLLEVHIEKGMRHNQKITFHGEVQQATCVMVMIGWLCA